MTQHPLSGLLICSAILILCNGCTTTAHKENADDAVYKIVAEVEEQIFGGSSEFTIDTPYSGRDPDDISPEEIFADRNKSLELTLTIEEALDLAVNQNRQFQSQKEQLYLTILTLTGEQHAFSPRFFARGTGVNEVFGQGEKRKLLDADAGVSQMIALGADISVTIATDILRFLTNDLRKTASSTLSFSIFQPLLRGAGREAAAERLTQAERNVIYSIRDFSHFQNTFESEIVLDYFRLLQQKDTILAAKSRYINAIVRYRNSLDQFKITLGLPQTIDLNLQDEEMERLQETGLVLLEINPTQGFHLAVDHRLPLFNAIDQFEDAKRRVRISANQLKGEVGIFANASVDSEGPTDYKNFDFDNVRRSVGLQLDLPLDRLRERNIYRASLIAFESELRLLGLTLDRLRSIIEEGIRELDRIQQNHAIQTNAVLLAEKQVVGAQLSIESGNAIYRDLEEAQDDLIAAQNAQTAALVDYLESRLGLLLELGIINTDIKQFWLTEASRVTLSTGTGRETTTSTNWDDEEVISPGQLFSQ